MDERVNKIKFSLVVTCFNEMESLPRWYENIISQTRQPDEIVIVDSESTDGTTQFLKNWSNRDEKVKIIVQKCKPARGHNIGNEAAKYEYIASTDMGVRLSPIWCEELIKPFEEDASIEVVAGNTQIDKESIKSAVARAEYYIENGGHANLEPGFVPGNRSMAYTKKLWRELGGLPEDLTFYADDSVFGRQIVEGGYKMGYAPKAMTYWERPQKLNQFWKEQFNYGRGDGEALIKTPFAFRLYKKGYLPKFLVPPLTGLRRMTRKPVIMGLRRALCKYDIFAFLYIPILEYGSGFHFGKAYLIGDIWGQQNCQECRKRLFKT